MKIKCLMVALAATLFACGGSPTPTEGFGPVGSKSFPIINGTPVAGQHDAVVGLHRLTKRYGGAIYVLPFCTGTLISPTVVLTAAHCLDKAESFAPIDPLKPNELAISFGDNPGGLDANGDYNLLGSLAYVGEVAVHPSYNKFTITNDIGLIRLKAPVATLPVGSLPAVNGFTAADVGSLTLTLVGFGQSEVDGTHGVKLTAEVTLSAIINDTQVEHLHSPEGICFGDSGGPALVTRDATRYVGGIASYVTAPYCENSGAHTRADAFEGWVNDFLSPPTEPPPVCENLLPQGASCDDGSECCSGSCKGKPSAKTCK